MSTNAGFIKEKIPNSYELKYGTTQDASEVSIAPKQPVSSWIKSMNKEQIQNQLKKMGLDVPRTLDECRSLLRNYFKSKSLNKKEQNCGTTQDASEIPIAPKPPVSSWIMSMNKEQIQKQLRKLGLNTPRTVDECRSLLRNYFKSKSLEKMEQNKLGAFQDEHLPKLELKEEHTIEESNVSETKQEDCFEDKHLPKLELKEEHTIEESNVIETKQEDCIEDKHLPKLELKEEHTIEESNVSETEQEDCLEVTESQNHNLSTQQSKSDHLPYQCTFCKYVFGIKSSFIDHEKNCKKTFNVSTVKGKRHKNKRVAGKQFVCCEEIFTVFEVFNSHKFSVHGIEFLVCGLCDKEKGTPYSLYNHYINKHFPRCNTHLKYLYLNENRTDSLVKSLKREEECTAAQEGLLCQCPICDRKFSNDMLPPVCQPHHVKSSRNEEKCTAARDGIMCQCPACDRKVSNDTPVCKPYVKSSRNEEECTAAQEGILCQCSICNRKVSNDTSAFRPYVCKICNVRYAMKSTLKKHMMRAHNLKRYPCDICAQSFTDLHTLKQHKLNKHNSDVSLLKFTCYICFKELNRKSSLINHIRNFHLNLNKGMKFPCPHCNKVLSHKKNLKSHVQLHLKDSQYTCDYCKKVFFNKEKIKNHIHSVHLGPVKCDICRLEVKSTQSLWVHKLKTHYKKTFGCEICGKISGTKALLEQHLIIHVDERPFVCQTCGKTFKREHNLKQHQHSHSSERPYCCDICGQSFRMRTHVKQHMAVHGIGNNHKCLLCNKFFARKKELNLHMSAHETSA